MATIATKVNAKTRDRFSKVILELGTTYARVRCELKKLVRPRLRIKL